jgi:hypothetical protein
METSLGPSSQKTNNNVYRKWSNPPKVRACSVYLTPAFSWCVANKKSCRVKYQRPM